MSSVEVAMANNCHFLPPSTVSECYMPVHVVLILLIWEPSPMSWYTFVQVTSCVEPALGDCVGLHWTDTKQRTSHAMHGTTHTQ